MTFSFGGPIDDAVRWVSKNLYDYLKPFRDNVTIYLLLPIRNFYLWLPWVIVIGVPTAIGWHFGGWRLALVPVGLFGFLLLAGFWTPLMLTIYLVTSCAILCCLIGIPLGVWAAKKNNYCAHHHAYLRSAANLPKFHLPDPGHYAVPDQ